MTATVDKIIESVRLDGGLLNHLMPSEQKSIIAQVQQVVATHSVDLFADSELEQWSVLSNTRPALAIDTKSQTALEANKSEQASLEHYIAESDNLATRVNVLILRLTVLSQALKATLQAMGGVLDQVATDAIDRKLQHLDTVRALAHAQWKILQNGSATSRDRLQSIKEIVATMVDEEPQPAPYPIVVRAWNWFVDLPLMYVLLAIWGLTALIAIADWVMHEGVEVGRLYQTTQTSLSFPYKTVTVLEEVDEAKTFKYKVRVVLPIDHPNYGKQFWVDSNGKTFNESQCAQPNRTLAYTCDQVPEVSAYGLAPDGRRYKPTDSEEVAINIAKKVN